MCRVSNRLFCVSTLLSVIAVLLLLQWPECPNTTSDHLLYRRPGRWGRLSCLSQRISTTSGLVTWSDHVVHSARRCASRGHEMPQLSINWLSWNIQARMPLGCRGRPGKENEVWTASKIVQLEKMDEAAQSSRVGWRKVVCMAYVHESGKSIKYRYGKSWNIRRSCTCTSKKTIIVTYTKGAFSISCTTIQVWLNGRCIRQNVAYNATL